MARALDVQAEQAAEIADLAHEARHDGGVAVAALRRAERPLLVEERGFAGALRLQPLEQLAERAGGGDGIDETTDPALDRVQLALEHRPAINRRALTFPPELEGARHGITE